MNIQTKQSNKAKAALNKLQFPSYRIVEDITTDEQLGKYSPELWELVHTNISYAIGENSKVYDDCERKMYGSL